MFFFFLACLACVLPAQAVFNEFIYPPEEGVNVTSNTPITLKWNCNAGDTPITLTAWQNKDNQGNWASQTLLDDIRDPGQYTWTPTPIEGLPITDGFHFEITYNKVVINSAALFIVKANQISSSSSSTSASSSTATQTSLSTPSRQTTGPTTTSSSGPINTATSDSSSGSNEALKIGLGVGLGIGIPLLLIVGGLAAWIMSRRAKRRKAEKYDPTNGRHELASEHVVNEAPPSKKVMEMTGDGWRHELHEDQKPSELPADPQHV